MEIINITDRGQANWAEYLQDLEGLAYCKSIDKYLRTSEGTYSKHGDDCTVSVLHRIKSYSSSMVFNISNQYKTIHLIQAWFTDFKLARSKNGSKMLAKRLKNYISFTSKTIISYRKKRYLLHIVFSFCWRYPISLQPYQMPNYQKFSQRQQSCSILALHVTTSKHSQLYESGKRDEVSIWKI